MSDGKQVKNSKGKLNGVDAPKSVSRRTLLKGTAKAMPMILTLQSGAVLARSSNMITAASPETRDRRGRALCLDTDSVYPARGTRDAYDLGEPAFARVNAINERDYRVEPSMRSRSISESEMCRRGVPGYYKESRHRYSEDSAEDYSEDSGQDSYSGLTQSNWQESGRSGWQKVQTKGIIVSATALTSFAGNIRITDL